MPGREELSKSVTTKGAAGANGQSADKAESWGERKPKECSFDSVPLNDSHQVPSVKCSRHSLAVHQRG